MEKKLIPSQTRYGRLVVLENVGKLYKCMCDCGNIVYTTRKYLVLGKKKSCGCLKRELTILKNKQKVKYNYNISKEDLLVFYVAENHSEKDTAEHFKTSIGAIETLLKKYDISKSGKRAKIKVVYPPKEKMIELYYDKKMSMKEIGKELGYCSSTISLILNYYKIPKLSPKEQNKRTLERYFEKTGYKSPSSNPKVREVAKKRSLEKYGVEFPQQTESHRQKMKQIMKEKELVNPNWKKEAKSKREKSCLEKYGVSSFSKTKDFKEKTKKTFLERYGVSSEKRVNMSPIYEEIIDDENKFKNWLMQYQNPKLTFYELANILKCSYSPIQQRVKKWHLQHLVNYAPMSSKEEREVKDIFTNIGIDFVENSREIIPPKEIDIFFPKYNFGIEYNGNFYHCESEEIGYTYHQNKSLECEQKGIQLFHLFAYEWENERKKKIILEMWKNKLGIDRKIIYARNCEIITLDTETKKNFLNRYHLQGNDHSFISYGLLYKSELVALMSFCEPRFNKKYDFELSRFVVKAGYVVVGGAGKLFKEFLRNNKGTIISYSDIGKTSGNMYKKLGFTLDHISKPNYVWWHHCTNEIKTRYQCQMKDEVKTMKSLGYARIFDAGNKVWIYDNNHSKSSNIEKLKKNKKRC